MIDQQFPVIIYVIGLHPYVALAIALIYWALTSGGWLFYLCRVNGSFSLAQLAFVIALAPFLAGGTIGLIAVFGPIIPVLWLFEKLVDNVLAPVLRWAWMTVVRPPLAWFYRTLILPIHAFLTNTKISCGRLGG